MRGERIDVLIAGGGFAGLALAIALKQALGDSFAVTVADPSLPGPAFGLHQEDRRAADPRASAIAAAARQLLEAIQVWQSVAGEAQPILDMAITDSRLTDAVRPVFLSFGGEIGPGAPFAHMVENDLLMTALLAKARDENVELRPTSVRDYRLETARLAARLEDGSTVKASLLVAADGARSHIRELAGISTVGWDYPQSAIVTTVAHERDHDGRAIEHFLPAGPFAILPLKGRRASLVWTEGHAKAARTVALPDADFHDELERRFGLELGEIALAGPRRVYPLRFLLARTFVTERVALIGDSAHVIHPIAGQGLNMGLRDVAALAEAVADAARLGLDVGGGTTLDRYQRWRRFDTMAMGITTDSLNRLFSNRSDALKAVRDLGLGIVDRLPGLKQYFIREAAGLTGDVPKLLRGQLP